MRMLGLSRFWYRSLRCNTQSTENDDNTVYSMCTCTVRAVSRSCEKAIAIHVKVDGGSHS